MALTQPDPAVLGKARRGDERAFAVLVRAYEGPLHTFVLRLVKSRDLAEDITQDVFLRAHRALPSFSGRSTFTTWLFQIAKNRVLDEVRMRERRPRAVVSIDDAPSLVAFDRPIEETEKLDAMWRAVGQLDIDLRSALLLRDIVGLSYNEIAEVLAITLATVKWRIYRAREDVAAAVALADAGGEAVARSA